MKEINIDLIRKWIEDIGIEGLLRTPQIRVLERVAQKWLDDNDKALKAEKERLQSQIDDLQVRKADIITKIDARKALNGVPVTP
jgi:hypothetical protein